MGALSGRAWVGQDLGCDTCYHRIGDPSSDPALPLRVYGVDDTRGKEAYSFVVR